MVNICVVTAVIFCGAGCGIVCGSPVETPLSRQAEPVSNGRLRVTGRGRAPERAMSKPQLRLMAKRAAMVEAYKNMVVALGEVRSSVVGGTGHETVRGFVKGIELTETRYYENGDVEVDIELVVPGGTGEIRAPRERRRFGGEEGLTMVERGHGKISGTYWQEMFGKKYQPGP